jgi:hypothetical protein
MELAKINDEDLTDKIVSIMDSNGASAIVVTFVGESYLSVGTIKSYIVHKNLRI